MGNLGGVARRQPDFYYQGSSPMRMHFAEPSLTTVARDRAPMVYAGAHRDEWASEGRQS